MTEASGVQSVNGPSSLTVVFATAELGFNCINSNWNLHWLVPNMVVSKCEGPSSLHHIPEEQIPLVGLTCIKKKNRRDFALGGGGLVLNVVCLHMPLEETSDGEQHRCNTDHTVL